MKMRMKFTMGIIIVLIITVVYFGYLYNKPHTGISNRDADVHISALNLYNDFQQDETVANKKYLNKVVEVTGNVSDVQTTDGSRIIFLGSAEALGGISCKLSNTEKDKNIAVKKSNLVTIKGKCSGYLMDVNLVDCIIK